MESETPILTKEKIPEAYALGFLVMEWQRKNDCEKFWTFVLDIISSELGYTEQRIGNLLRWARQNNIAPNTVYRYCDKLEENNMIKVNRDGDKILFLEIHPVLMEKLKEVINHNK